MQREVSNNDKRFPNYSFENNEPRVERKFDRGTQVRFEKLGFNLFHGATARITASN